MNVDVIIGTYGDRELWAPLAHRAYTSATEQTVQPDNVIVFHGATLAEARNNAAGRSTAEWLVFLDADDELDSGYIEGILAGNGDLRQPRTLGFTNEVPDGDPIFVPAREHLLIGNHLVIGTGVRRTFFERSGGFRELPILEDWDLWLRCWILGAEIGTAPDAVYLIHHNQNGRNAAPNWDETYLSLQQEHWISAQERGLV